MKDLKKLVNDYSSNEITKAAEKVKAKEQSSTFINLVFHNLKLIFPAWKQNFTTTQSYQATKELWLNTLIDEGINTQKQIDRGLKAAKLSETAFFPSIGQFVSWTKKAAPRVNEQAYKEFTFELPRHTKEEYQEFAKNGMDKIKRGE